MRASSAYVVAAGLRTHYLHAGYEGPPVVLVHGGGAGADARGNWAGVMSRLESRARLYAVDMPGFGGTEKPRSERYGYSQSERETHLAAFLEALGVGPVTLVGNSMGGLTALGVARDRPELVGRLVLMGSAGIAIPGSAELKSILEYDFTVAGMARIVAALTGPGFKVEQELVDYRYALSVDPDTRYAYGRITGWMKARGGLQIEESAIESVRVPTLVVAGKNDRVVPVHCAYRFLELISQSHGYILPNCGHWPMIERPGEFARLLETFMGHPAEAA